MSKEYLEALEKVYYGSQGYGNCDENYKIVKQALHRLESIDNSNPSEALECLEKLKGMEISSMPFSDEYGTQEVDLNDIRKVGSQLNTDFREYTTTIKQALLKAEKEHKALEIIKGTFMWLEDNPYVIYVGRINDIETMLTEEDFKNEEEFNTLKEVLE